jgi:4-amino-4-deoxy-L-arabinose transferase-like glycosyltransferase
MEKKVLWLILAMSLFKCFFAFTLELGNDEAYYWLFSQYLQWNYFDHPPMVAVWIRLFTGNLLLEQYEGFIRMGSIVGSALASWFIFKAVALIHSERAGWFGACLYHASFYAGITAGLYILPDSPQMVFWTFSMWMVARIIVNDQSWMNWILFGIGAGLCIMSKVHGVFLWTGMGLYVLFQRNKWFANPRIYISFLVTLLIISPIFLWNLKYDFITYRFHSERVALETFKLTTKNVYKELLNQLSLNNSFNVALMIFGLIAWRKRQLKRFRALAVYNLIGIPLALLLLFITLFRNTVLPHWSGPAYVSLLPLAAVYLAERNSKAFPKILGWALAIFILGLTAMWLIIKFLPGTYGNQTEYNLGRKDLTLDMYGWTEGGKQFQTLYKKDIQGGLMPAGAPLVSSDWGIAHTEYYFARQLGMRTICFGEPEAIHEYLWINQWRAQGARLDSAYCITSSTKPFFVPWRYYDRRQLAGTLEISRSGKPAQRFYVFRLTGLKKPLTTVKEWLMSKKTHQ